MSESCTHNCSTCSSSCKSQENIEKFAPLHKMSSIKKVIGIVSGKGGVGKSLTTSLLAVKAAKRGLKVGILDADITGPSIPKIFGINEMAMGDESGIFPAETALGIKIMSLNLLLEDKASPVAWRGPIIAGTVKQFWTDVIWGELDVLYIDMPPGTGDVALTVFQSIPVDGIVMVTSPQDLVGLIVEKAINLANLMEIPVIGLIENYSYFKCPDCGKTYEIFGKSKVDELADRFGFKFRSRVPIDPKLAELCDSGEIEKYEGEYLKEAEEYC
ncbi:MAG: P-loop NTPase [Eubacteriales bacterium]